MRDLSAYQVNPNGPLTKEAISILDDARLKYRWTYKTLGERLGISGGFAHNILNKGGNITTNTVMPRIADGIERLKAGETEISGEAVEGDDTAQLREHSYHLRSDLEIAVSLPLDLTEREAERLALFIRSLAH